MATITITYNHSRDPMQPAQLADTIATSLALATVPTVDITPTSIVVTHASITSANTAAITTLINAYVFDATWAGGAVGKLQSRALVALGTNATFLAITSPTAVQVATQAKALTRQADGIIRLLLNQLDTISDS